MSWRMYAPVSPLDIAKEHGPIVAMVYLAMMDHAQGSGQCFVGRKRLAELCGVSVASVKRARKTLADAGLVRVERRFSDKGEQSSLTHVEGWKPRECTGGHTDPGVGSDRPAREGHTDPGGAKPSKHAEGHTDPRVTQTLPGGHSDPRTTQSELLDQKKTTNAREARSTRSSTPDRPEGTEPATQPARPETPRERTDEQIRLRQLEDKPGVQAVIHARSHLLAMGIGMQGHESRVRSAGQLAAAEGVDVLDLVDRAIERIEEWDRVRAPMSYIGQTMRNLMTETERGGHDETPRPADRTPRRAREHRSRTGDLDSYRMQDAEEYFAAELAELDRQAQRERELVRRV